MTKEFDVWNVNKKNIQDKKPSGVKFHPREVWWCALGVNIGSEQDGIGDNFERPVVIIKNLSPSTFIILPLSTKEKLAQFQFKVNINYKQGYALLDQIKVINSKRLLRKIGYIEKQEYTDLMGKFINMFKI